MNTNITRKTLALNLSLLLLLTACTPSESNENSSECPAILLSNYEEEWPNDALFINSVSMQDQELSLNISHSGGCEEHEYELIQDPLFCGTPPIYISIHLSHESNDDLCEALITRDLCFDISSIYEGFPDDSITIVLTNFPHQADTTWLIE